MFHNGTIHLAWTWLRLTAKSASLWSVVAKCISTGAWINTQEVTQGSSESQSVLLTASRKLNTQLCKYMSAACSCHGDWQSPQPKNTLVKELKSFNLMMTFSFCSSHSSITHNNSDTSLVISQGLTALTSKGTAQIPDLSIQKSILTCRIAFCHSTVRIKTPELDKQSCLFMITTVTVFWEKYIRQLK